MWRCWRYHSEIFKMVMIITGYSTRLRPIGCEWIIMWAFFRFNAKNSINGNREIVRKFIPIDYSRCSFNGIRCWSCCLFVVVVIMWWREREILRSSQLKTGMASCSTKWSQKKIVLKSIFWRSKIFLTPPKSLVVESDAEKPVGLLFFRPTIFFSSKTSENLFFFLLREMKITFSLLFSYF